MPHSGSDMMTGSLGLLTSVLEPGKKVCNLFHVADLQMCISLFSLQNMDISQSHPSSTLFVFMDTCETASGQDLFVMNEIFLKQFVYETWSLILSLSCLDHSSLGPLSELKGDKMHFCLSLSKYSTEVLEYRRSNIHCPAGILSYSILGRLRVRRYHMK